MKTLLSEQWKLIAGAVLVILLTGCSVVPEAAADLTRYYVLTNSKADDVANTAGNNGLKIGLKLVQVSPYLDKGSLVVRRGSNELIYNDYARWAEPISEGVSRIAHARLLDTPKVSRVFVNSFPFDQSRDYDISIHVTRCEGAVNGGVSEARFTAIVEITTTGDDAEMVSRMEFIAPSREWDGRDYGALTQLLSESISGLCDDVVVTLPQR
jgi:uncharacterized lipoprotein YmbA